ncbi:MAG TPA: zf-HC2 domain-containing protein [Myxococcales bacterium]|nr:zf-HC2 domain-containing protein [Myxococcales bacterium]
MPLDCHELESFLPAYVDGEFDAYERAEVEAHLAGCAACQHAVRIQAAMKDAVRRAAPAVAPIELRHSVQVALREEEVPGSRWESVLRNPRSVGLAAAAVGAAVWFLAGGMSHPLWPRHSGMVDDSVAIHMRSLPLDYAANDVTSVQQWLQSRLDFAARVPRFRQGPALQGVRLSHLRSRPAAVLSYSVPQPDGHRVSLFIVDDPDDGDPPGTVRRVADRQVWLSQSRGYNVVSWRTNEIVYQLISDLDERDVLQLVQAVELR